jgi:hypothetical protein
LSAQPGLTVIQADLADLRDSPTPDAVVIVDAAQTTEALALLRPHPAWRLLSVDAATGTLTTYAARAQAVHGMDEILHYLTRGDKQTGKWADKEVRMGEWRSPSGCGWAAGSRPASCSPTSSPRCSAALSRAASSI